MESHVERDGAPLLVAVSGGVDSVVMLHLLKQYSNDTGTRLEAIHIHHGIREASDVEGRKVQSMCDAWNVPLHVRHLNMGALTPPYVGGFEAAARKLRYDAFTEIAKQVGTNQVALGHHLDDQAETMLWRMARGTSLDGLAGIRPVSTREGITWLRPLLQFEKKDLYTYAREHSLEFSEDESNSDDTYTRNFIRHQVIPKLREIQSSAVKSMGQLAELLQEDEAWMKDEAEIWVREHISCDTTVYHVPAEPFRRLPRPLQRRVIKIILYCLTSGDFSLPHIQSVVDLACSNSPSARVELPHQVSAMRLYGTLRIGWLSDEAPPFTNRLNWDLADGTHLVLGELGWPHPWEFMCRNWTPSDGVKAQSLFQLNVPRHVNRFEVRTYHSGDRIAPIGLKGHTKKLQDVFTDAKVHRQVRRTWPVFCFENEIIWIPGISRSAALRLGRDEHIGWVIEASAHPPII